MGEADVELVDRADEAGLVAQELKQGSVLGLDRLDRQLLTDFGSSG
ncbi:hypothetical protein GTY54_18485 [Streptomyces sp. SID625]|nr:hypothetical protein [Streptomyces sp. SID625]